MTGCDGPFFSPFLSCRVARPQHYGCCRLDSCHETCPVHCSMFSNIPGFYSRDANIVSALNYGHQKCLQTLLNRPLRTKSFQLRTMTLLGYKRSLPYRSVFHMSAGGRTNGINQFFKASAFSTQNSPLSDGWVLKGGFKDFILWE